MPVGQTADFYLGGRPYMLSRAREYRGRAWNRTGDPDTPSRRGPADLKYGQLPSEIEHVEVWDDWSGGFGDAYRDPANPNRLHWAENMDYRFPRQMVHCQQMANETVSLSKTTYISDIPDIWATRSIAPLGLGGLLQLESPGYANFYRFTGHNALSLEMGLDVNGLWGNRPAIFGSFMYLPRSTGSFYQVRVKYTDGTSDWTIGPMPGRGFTVAGNRLWRYHGLNLLQSCAAGADPMGTANWSATLPIGDGYAQIQDMIELSDQVFVGMADGLYAGDQTGTFYNVLSELRNQRHEDNCRDLTAYNGGVVAPHVAGIYWYQPSDYRPVAREIGPPVANRSPIKGRVRAVRSAGRWLYAGLWTGSGSYLLCANAPYPEAPYTWYTLQRLPHVAMAERIHLDAVTALSSGVEIPNRIWVSTNASFGGLANCTSPLYVWPIPRNDDNPLASDPVFSPNYVGSARADMPAVDWGAPATWKTFRAVEIEANNLLSGVRYADVYYTADEGTRATLGRAQTSPKSTLYFPTGEGSWAGGYRVALSVESFTASVNISPVYRSIALRGALRPKSADLITAVIRIADDMRDRGGSKMRPGVKMLAELRALAEGTAPARLVDLAGVQSWVNVLAPVQEQEVYQEGAENPELVASVRMAVQEFE